MNSHAQRLEDHAAVSRTLAARSDAQLTELLGGDDRHVGIGGSTHTIEVAGRRVFVKLIRVTDIERVAGAGCTKNLYELPTCYQYGVGEGSTGFGVWREVAAHESANAWVLNGECDNFPLLHHWRELPQPNLDVASADPDSIDRAVRFWGESRAIGTRLRALEASQTVVALFLEHIPFVLRPWLTDRLNTGGAHAQAAVQLVDEQLLRAVVHLRAHGMSHFDAHFDNVLTDGERIYLSDFGLVTSRHFQLDATERDFVALTADHDLAYCATALVNAIARTRIGLARPDRRNEYLRGCSSTARAPELTGPIANAVVRYATLATLVNDFYWKLHDGDLTAEYPATAIAEAIERTSLR